MPGREEHSWTCNHKQYVVDLGLRTVRCSACAADLDAFSILAALTRQDGYLARREQEARKLGARVSFLKSEERKTKERLKNVTRKDADAAVAAERAKWEKRLRRIVHNAREVARLAGKIERAGSGEELRRAPRARVPVESAPVGRVP